jgi:assimilatory nitrate reductase catalytic subunit
MHWTDAFSSSGPVGRIVTAALDPISGQPELKATPVRVEPVQVRWRGLLLHRHEVRPEAADLHWSRIPLPRGHALDLAGTAPLADPAALAAALLLAPSGADCLEVADPGRKAWRFAVLIEGRLEACLFLAEAGGAAALPARETLAAMLGLPVADLARAGLLAGRSAAAAQGGRTVCACFSVGLTTLREAVASRRLTTVAEIGAALHAGTNCGSCIPELREIVRDALADAA